MEWWKECGMSEDDYALYDRWEHDPVSLDNRECVQLAHIRVRIGDNIDLHHALYSIIFDRERKRNAPDVSRQQIDYYVDVLLSTN